MSTTNGKLSHDNPNHVLPKYYERLDPQPWDLMLEADLDGVQSMVLRYLARAGHKDEAPRVQDYKKAVTCIEKLLEVHAVSSVARYMEVTNEDLDGHFPKRIAGWLLPIPILMILRWLLAAWVKGSTDKHQDAIDELEKLIAVEEVKNELARAQNE